jgi:ATP-dependent Clp protease ATP-binding subunit ClpB
VISFEKFTVKAQEAIASAQELAQRKDHTEMTPVHLLSALLQQDEGVIVPLVKRVGSPMSVLEAGVERQLVRLPRLEKGLASPTPSIDLQETIKRALSEADELHDEYVSTEHLFLALIGDHSGTGALLAENGITREAVLKALTGVRGSQRVTDQNPETKYRALERFTRDFVDLARRGKLDPVIGRDEEIRRVSQVLSRRTKNNPVLIGEPGVGKTAIVEGLA